MAVNSAPVHHPRLDHKSATGLIKELKHPSGQCFADVGLSSDMITPHLISLTLPISFLSFAHNNLVIVAPPAYETR